MTKINNVNNLCPSCGNLTDGNFCSNCGEKIIERNYSLKEFFSNVLEGFYNFDSKFLRSLKYLITKPGFLTNEFIAGRRVKYTKPFQLFLIVNIIMFFTSLYFSENIFTSTLNNQRNFMPYSSFVKRITDNQIENQKITFVKYEEKFNSRLENYSKSFVMVIIPLLAIMLKLTNRKRYYVEHLVYSTHYFTFVLFLLGVFLIPFFIAISLLIKAANSNLMFNTDIIIVPFIFISFISYFYFSLKKVYNDRSIFAFVKSIILFIIFMFLFIVYRFLLFLIVYFSLNIF